MRTKQFDMALTIDRNKREILCFASSDNVDRENEVVLPSGLRTKGINYAGRPILWSHDRTLPSIGTILWLKPQDRALLCKYRVSDKTQFARDIYELLTDDPPALRYHSVGMDVFAESPPTKKEIAAHPEWAGCRNVVRDYEILELSICNVPANDTATAILKSKSLSTQTRELLGDAWKEKACWEYETKPAEKALVLPVPTYVRRWQEMESEIIADAIEKRSACCDDIMNRIKGRA